MGAEVVDHALIVRGIGGRSVGIIATNPAHNQGMVDDLGAQKLSRHIELCDAWQLPIVSLVDTLGTCTRWTNKDKTVSIEPGHSSMHARCITAHQRREVPLLSVQTRHGRGLAPALLTGYSSGASVAAMMVAWPSVELNRADGYSLVRDANAFDDIIQPDQTRQRLLRVLKLLPGATPRHKKHRAVDPW